MIVTTTMSSTSVKPPTYFRRGALMERADEKRFLIGVFNKELHDHYMQKK